MALKYGIKDISALKFDAPLVDVYPIPIIITCEEYNFLTDWTLNPNQPQGGIEVTEHTITIKKFKPNEWFIKSNYSIADDESYYDKFYNKSWSLQGVNDNRGVLSGYTFHPFGDASQTYNAYGVVLSPCLPSGSLLSDGFPWDMNIPSGYFKGGVSGWNNFGYYSDGNWQMFNWKVWDAPWGSRYNEVALAIFSSYEPDESGFITLTADYKVADPTTVEGFVGILGENTVYNKPKTYANILDAYGFSFKETGKYTEIIQGATGDDIVDSYAGSAKTAFVISTRDWDDKYEYIRLPEVIDFGELISEGFPFKFWARLSKGDARTHIWDSLVDAFENTPITGETFANHLFAKSSGNGTEFIDNIHLTFNLPEFDVSGNPIEAYLDMGGIFDHSNLFKNVRFTVNSGTLKVLHNVFRGSSITGITFDNPANISDFSGAFESCMATNFPENISPKNEMAPGSKLSEGTCNLNYAADANQNGLAYFGCYKNESGQSEESKYYTANVGPFCPGAFSRAPRLTELRYILDMKFVYPGAATSHAIDDITWGGTSEDGDIFNAAFNMPYVTTAKIKNINKGVWNLDGTARNGYCDGNLNSFNADSVNYLLNNIFDLRQNDTVTGDIEHFKNDVNCFNEWNASDGQKYSVTYICWPNTSASLSKTITAAGEMKVKVSLTNCTLTLNNGGTQRTITGGEQTISLATGTCTFTFTKTGNYPKGSLELTDHFKTELTPGFTASSIYLPASLKSRTSTLAIQTAQERGWNVYFGGELEPTVTTDPCTFQFELNGASYADNNSNQEIRFYDNSGYDDSFGMVTPGSSVGSVNTSFETVSIPANTQNTNVYVTKSSTPFTVTIANDEASKEMQATYRFSGDRNGQTVKVTAHFKNLTDTSAVDKEIEYTEGDGYAATLELYDWFVSGGTVRVQVSFRLEAN